MTTGADEKPVLLSHGGPGGSVLTVTLNRPGRLNALDAATLRELRSAWRRATRPDVRVVVITGAGRGFCAGADLRASTRADTEPEYDALRDGYNPHILELFRLDIPVIAAVNGPVAGAGLAIAFASDIRLAAESAKFVPAFAQIGLIPDSGATFLIPHVLGSARAFEWLATANALSARAALTWSIVSDVVPDDELLPRAQELARQLAGMPGRAVELTKRAINHEPRRQLLEHVELEVELQRRASSAEGRDEARRGVVSAISSNHQPEEQK